MPFLAVLAVTACLLGQAAPPSGPVVALETVSAGRFTGTLLSISAGGEVRVVRPSGGTVNVPLEDVIRAEMRRPDAPAPGSAGLLLLAGEGEIHGTVVESNKTGVTLQSPLLGRVHLPFAHLAGYLPPAPRVPAGRWRRLREELRRTRPDEDLVHLKSGDRVPGVVEELSPGRVVVSGPLGRQEFSVEEVTAVDFSAHGNPAPGGQALHVLITLADGSTFPGRILSLTGGRFDLQALAGFRARVPVAAVSAFEVRNGRVVWLAEVEPAETDYVPYYNRVWPVRRDRSVWGRPLTVKGRVFRRGLGLASRTTLRYRLDGAFERLEAFAGIDDETEGRGKALLAVSIDGKRVFSRLLEASREPIPIDVPLAGVRELVITVDFGPEGDAGDHLDLGAARLVRRRAGGNAPPRGSGGPPAP